MKSFSAFNLSAELERAVATLGYENPTPIQVQTLPILLEGETDFLGLAATGTGKTAAFAIPLLEKIDPTLRQIQGLVLCPTRELAIQVTEQMNLLGQFKGIRALPIYGGAGYGDQMKGLKKGVPIVVSTPGRLLDHLERGTVTLDHLKVVILDEADEMISMGFKEEIESILESIPLSQHSTWLFSATMSREVRKVADRFLKNPQMVQVNKTEMLSGTVKQIYYVVKESDKLDILCKLVDVADEFYGLVFCQTKSLVIDTTDLLKRRGYQVDCLHGDMDQTEREKTMKKFRARQVNLLICTDVASRGIDVKELTHVINYSIPRELDSYVHRIGRTGRSGKSGFALSLVTASHLNLIPRIEKMTQSKMQRGTIPSRKEIAQKKLGDFLVRFKVDTHHSRAQSVLSAEWKQALAEMSSEEIAGRFLSLSYPDLFLPFENPPKAPPVSGSYDVVKKSFKGDFKKNANAAGYPEKGNQKKWHKKRFRDRLH